MKKRNLFFKMALVMIITVFGIISCDLLANKTLRVPDSMITKELNKKFPIEKNFLLGKVGLKSPVMSFAGDRLYFTADYDVSLLAGKAKGKVFLNSQVKFDPKTNKVYLVDLDVTKVTDEKGNKIDDSVMAKSLKALISNYLETNEVYTYDDDKKVKVKNMFIKDGKLFVQT
ncbi:MAG: DUF1439 domain-containing protein [Leptotrichia wadei]|jgi:hypothetical protein|uniref:Lipoprotein n=1 Tax=Leptotrichia wadei TaxID=157687 RepID=A0A510KRI9_9FUSO|nr:DUF1439 domain-containing protein [Leptotrichia wadei]MBS6019951.1 DUF1439 domain-containing protein [Leptotrichia wadei]BBM54358.1 hypothetical protein JMUB3936_0642 [Leptotrichia wadei]